MQCGFDSKCNQLNWVLVVVVSRGFKWGGSFIWRTTITTNSVALSTNSGIDIVAIDVGAGGGRTD